MKKLILSLAMLVGSSSVLPLVASAESMYQDIMGSIVNTSLVENDEGRLQKLQNVLCRMYYLKDDAQRSLIEAHGKVKDIAALTIDVMAATFAIAWPFVSEAKPAKALLISSVLGIGVMSSLASKEISCYFAKKKLAELNEVFAKLEAAKDELQNKVAAQQQEQDATADEQQA